MNWIYIILGVLIGIVLLILIIGTILPRKHHVSLSKILPGSQNKIWVLISDFANYRNWRSNLKGLEVLSDDTWRETDERNSKITFQIISKEGQDKLVSKIIDDKLPFGGSWTFELKHKSEHETELTITENGEIYNVIFRFFARFVFGYTSTIKQYFNYLETHLMQ